MKTNVRSISSLSHAVVKAQRDQVAYLAETNPVVLADNLLASPGLAVGLKNFDYIVDCLLKGGQADKLFQMLDSRALGGATHARRVITEKLLTWQPV